MDCTHTKLTMPLKPMIRAKNVFTLKFCFLCVVTPFFTQLQKKNKSPKILIIFPFFWTKYSFPLNFLPVGLLYNKIFQVTDWVLNEKDGYLKGHRECSEQRMMGKWFQSLIIYYP